MRNHVGAVLGGWVVWAGLGAVAMGATGTTPGETGGGGPSPSIPRDLLHLPTGGSAARDNTVRMPVTPGPAMPKQQTNQRPMGAGPAVPYANDPGVWDEKSWICWWETNRDAVLQRVMARRAPQSPAGDDKPPAERAHAVAALLRATQAERPALRAAAAVSLGQIRQGDALKRLVELGQKDADAYVRGMAWLAVGLVGSPDAEKVLVAVKPRDEFEQLGLIAGIGMLDRPSESTFKLLQGLIAQPPSPEVGRAAMWALRVFHRPADHDAIVLALSSGAPPQVVVEGLLALGAIGDGRDTALLADATSDGRPATASDQTVINGGGTVRRGGTYQFPEQPGLGGTPPSGARTTALVRRQQDFPRNSPPTPSPFGARSPLARTSAALALGVGENGRSMAAGSIPAQNRLIQNVAPYLDQGGPMYAGASVLAFAAGAAPKDIYIVRDLLDMGTDPILGLVNPKSPLRGYAALGIGLYLAGGGTPRIETRPAGTVQVGVDSGLPDYLDLNETLALRYANKQESQELRAACALALGLSGDSANVQRLLKGAERIDRRDELLLGYTVLALAMLGEKTAINAAGPLVSAGAAKLDADAIAARGVGQLWFAPAALSPKAATDSSASAFDAPAVPQNGPGMMGVLGRRAALLGMAVLNDPRSETILAGAWGRDHSTVQDVARTMGWCKAYKPAEALAQVVDRDQKGTVEATMSLGWVFDAERPSRLSRLVVGNNYHVPQADWVDRPGGSTFMVRNFPRVGDLYLYSSPIGGTPVPPSHAPAAPTTRRATRP